jgi:hypothetical protein
MIYISKDGRHFFDIEPRTHNNDEFKRVLKTVIEKFPESEGYKILAQDVTCYSKGVDINEFLGTDNK